MLHDRIRAFREDKDLTQKEVASRLGVSQRVYSNYECGQVTPSIYSLIILANIYGVSLDFLVGRTPFDNYGGNVIFIKSQTQLLTYFNHERNAFVLPRCQIMFDLKTDKNIHALELLCQNIEANNIRVGGTFTCHDVKAKEINCGLLRANSATAELLTYADSYNCNKMNIDKIETERESIQKLIDSIKNDAE